jgi:hypothetical protein
MKRLLILIAVAVTMTARPSAFVVVPNELANVEGNRSMGGPFTGPDAPGPGGEFWDSVRYQQVYDASQFAAVRPEGEFITAIYFRADSPAGYPFGVVLRDVVMSLSTTSKGPDNLSTNFDENVGPDAVVIFPRGQFESGSGYTPGYSPQTFQMDIIPTPWFFYRPSAGNLLLDVKVFTYSNSFPAAPLDASGVLGDSISTLGATNVLSSTGRPSTQGLVTAFVAWFPVLQIFQTNATTLTLYWGQGIEGFVLQTTTNVGPAATWTPAPEPVTVNGSTRIVEVPIQTNRVASYYRLVWNPPLGKSLLADAAEAADAIPAPSP